jgi:hypothetical protein
MPIPLIIPPAAYPFLFFNPKTSVPGLCPAGKPGIFS